jgi:outer membrane biosynthesis protein TonB
MITTGMSNAARLAAAALMLAGFSAAAQAQVTAAQQSAIRANCRSDFMAKCSGVTPGGKDALMCLQKNVDSLSPGCQQAVSVTIPKPAEAAPAPKPAEAKPVEAKPAPAPAAAKAEPAPTAAPPPKAAVAHPPKKPKKPATAKAEPVPPPPPPPPMPAAAPPPPPEPKRPVVDAAVMLRACKLDLIRHCRDVPPGEGRKVACLMDNSDHLTIRCRTALKVTAPIR